MFINFNVRASCAGVIRAGQILRKQLRYLDTMLQMVTVNSFHASA